MNIRAELLTMAASSDEGWYVPPFDEVCRHLFDGNVPAGDTVDITVKFFRFLMLGWLSQQHFNEAKYRSANLDVDEACRKGEIESGWAHYVTTGYFEGRHPGEYFVDPAYYRRTYPDVAMAERRGETNPDVHFGQSGRLEGRSGSRLHHTLRVLWLDALTHSASHSDDKNDLRSPKSNRSAAM